MVREEEEALPLLAAIHALGHIGSPNAIPLVVEQRFHPNPDVRFAVACALGTFADDPVSIDSLLELTQDVDEDVRDWATFALGVLGSADSPDIRNALVRGLGDSNDDVREEAMIGLGKRRDRRVLAILLSALELPDVAVRAIEAASEMLDMQSEREDWTATDYAAALRDRFSL
jgi:HEAT repeat protein